MACEDLTLDINTACSEVTGDYTSIGWVFPYDDVVHSSVSVTDLKATFYLKGTSGFRVYDRSFRPFAGCTHLSENNDRYVVFHDQAIIPLFVNNQINAKIANYLGAKRIVLMLENVRKGENAEAQYPLFGIISGLQFQSSISDTGGLVAHDVTLQDTNTGYPALFYYSVDEAFTNKMRKALTGEDGYYYIEGMRVNTNEGIGIADTTSSSNASISIRLPDNSVEDFGATVEYEMTLDSGAISVNILNVGTTGVAISGTMYGNIATNLDVPVTISYNAFTRGWLNQAPTVTAVGCTSLIELHCRNATNVNVTGCTSFGVSVVCQMILEMYAANKADGTLALNLSYAVINAYDAKAGAALTDMDNNRGWTISFPA